ncbi:unannotated protein [freshwater metagenome]|uniref:Unannotated protein n=1 Tax=freshwater metagenome TaxID=449393 RepID=A0A6J7SFD0_9ZZZZ
MNFFVEVQVVPCGYPAANEQVNEAAAAGTALGPARRFCGLAKSPAGELALTEVTLVGTVVCCRSAG